MGRFFIIDPKGRTHHRGSKKCLYTHAVIARPNVQFHIEQASRTWASLYELQHHRDVLDGISGHLWQLGGETDEDYQFRLERLRLIAVAEIGDCTTLEDYRKLKIQREVDRIKRADASGAFDWWRVVDWCISREAAERVALNGEQRRGRTDHRIVDVIAD